MVFMKAIGVKQLKARLSEYLRLVKAGETVLVTDRDQVVAEISPARTTLNPARVPGDILDSLAEAGEMTRSRLPKSGWTFTSRGLGLASGTAQRLLDELRDERI